VAGEGGREESELSFTVSVAAMTGVVETGSSNFSSFCEGVMLVPGVVIAVVAAVVVVNGCSLNTGEAVGVPKLLLLEERDIGAEGVIERVGEGVVEDEGEGDD